VPLPEGLNVSGVILADQIKSLDWRVSKTGFAAATIESVVNDVVSLVLPLIDEAG
jgi:mRNA interferase MazF